MKHCLILAVLLLLSPIVHAQDIALRGATIHTAVGDPIENGLLLISDGAIQYVGSGEEIRLDSDITILDVTGKTIIPGLVDTHSHVGIYSRPAVSANADGNEATDPITPQLRARDAIWPADPGIRMALAGGVTTANIMPGSGNVIGGQTAYVKLRGNSVEDMLIPGSLGGLKMANGENPKRNYGSRGKQPSTRMAVAALAREMFSKAQAYQKEWQDWNNKSQRERSRGKAPKRNLQLEPLVEVLEGKRIVQHHTHRADDIQTVLRLADEFGFRVVIQHGTEAYKVANELAAANIPASLIIIDSPGGKHEVGDYNQAGAAILHDAGVKVAIHTDDFINNSRFLLREAALAIRYGMPEDAALKSLTLYAAEMLDLDDQLGSLEAGKDADFVVLDGAPFSVYTKVEQTWIDGMKVFDRTNPQDLRYATGGFAVQHQYPQGGGQ